MWPIDAKYLGSIYRLPHSEAACLHDEDSCVALLKMLVEYFRGDALNEKSAISRLLAKTEKQVLTKALDYIKCQAEVRWLPDYGCLLLISRDDDHDPQTVALNTLGLDLHAFDMVGHTRSDNYQHTADARDYQALHVGTMPALDVVNFRHKFETAFQEATERTGDERSARGGKQGHQRTPAFVHAVQRQAFYCECAGKCKCEEEPSLGGFTDVGLHTGGASRNTSWPLVRSLLRHALDQVNTTSDGRLNCDSGGDAELVFRKALVTIGLVVTRKLLNAAEQAERYDQRILLDSAQAILSHAALEASALADDGHDMARFRTLLAKRSKGIETVANTAFGEQFQQPSLQNFHKNFPCRNLTVSIPPEVERGLDSENSEHLLLRGTEKNIGWIPAPPAKADFQSLSSWLQHSSFGKDLTCSSALLALRTVESNMWGTAKQCFSLSPVGGVDCDVLLSVVDQYRVIMHMFLKMPESKSLMRVEQRSKELVVVWVAYCVIYRNTDAMHQDIMPSFGVGLDVSGLRHLVLRGKEAIDAALAVASYLNKRTTAMPIFTLKDEMHTRVLGILYSQKHLSPIMKQEQKNAASRTTQHWDEVCRKQQLARALRKDLAALRSQSSTISCDLNAATSEQHEHVRQRRRAYADYYGSEEDRWQYDGEAHAECNERVNQLQGQRHEINRSIEITSQSLQEAGKPPQPVHQPLPKDETLANQVLFFLHMPHEFRLLARMTCTAQQMLVPFPWVTRCGGEDGTTEVDIYDRLTCDGKKCQESWTEWYNSHQQDSTYPTPCVLSGLDSHVFLRAERTFATPKRIKHVDELTSSDHGVWYPDAMIPRMAWYGGPLPFDQISSREFDPFGVDDQWTVSYFTEKLPIESLQWALHQPGNGKIPLTRGNRPLASQNSKPGWLSKQGYLTFGKIRSHPYSQLRNVCTALAERALPLSEPAVQVLLRQAIYHLGNISCNNNRTILDWKRDLYDGDLPTAAYSILSGLSEEIRESPKQYQTARLVGELSNFFGQWNPSCREVARQVAASLQSFAQGIDEQI